MPQRLLSGFCNQDEVFTGLGGGGGGVDWPNTQSPTWRARGSPLSSLSPSPHNKVTCPGRTLSNKNLQHFLYLSSCLLVFVKHQIWREQYDKCRSPWHFPVIQAKFNELLLGLQCYNKTITNVRNTAYFEQMFIIREVNLSDDERYNKDTILLHLNHFKCYTRITHLKSLNWSKMSLNKSLQIKQNSHQNQPKSSLNIS